MAETYEAIKKKCLEEGTLFEDPEFPATFRSLFLNTVETDLAWKRPKELTKTPVFMREATYRDMNQGQIGDCWFISAVNCLMVSNKRFFDKVVPSNQSFTEDYAGIFRFNFWHFGEWKQVLVDDRIPVNRITYKTLYARNNSEPDEFWVCLLEKAYAKLVGCYQSMQGGITSYGIADLTGGITEYIVLSQEFDNKAEEVDPIKLFQRMRRMWAMKTMFSCGIIDREVEAKRDDGLITVHAYSIIKLATIEYQGKEVNLVKLRNPWGKKEWRGPWSDSSEQWKGLTEQERKRIGLVVRDDGEFWMDIHDLVSIFTILDMCHIDPFATTDLELPEDCLEQRDWNSFKTYDRWLKKVTSGGDDISEDLYWKNPQYLLEVPGGEDVADVRIVIALMHHPQIEDSLRIGMHLYKLKPDYPTPLPENVLEFGKMVKTGDMAKEERETSFGIELVPGSYVLVPYNTEKNSAEFLLRIFAESKVSVRSLDDIYDDDLREDDKIEKPPEDLLAVLFNKNTPSTKVDAHQLRRILNTMWKIDKMVVEDACSLETCRCLIENYEKGRDGLLNLEEARSCWKRLKQSHRIFNSCDIDDSGAVNINELLPFYRATSPRLSKTVTVNICIRYADQDGRITFDDFCQSLARFVVLGRTYLKNFADDTKLNFNEWFTHVMVPR